jgi:hypothetical protein
MLKLGVFRTVKSKKAIINLTLGAFSNVVSAAKIEIEDIGAIVTNEIGTISYTESEQHARSLLHEMQRYFRRDVALEWSERSEIGGLIDKYIDTCQLSIYEYNKSRVSEKLNINLNGLELFPKFPNLWLVFYFSEILYFLLNDDFKATFSQGVVILAPHEKYDISFRRDWLSGDSEGNSNIADLLSLKSRENFIYRSRITLENSEDIVTMCLDKIFSLKSSMLSEKLQNCKDLVTLKEIVLFSACVECASYKENYIPESFFRKRTDIRDKTINSLIAVLRKDRKDKSIASLENFVLYENRFFKRGLQNFKFGLKKLAGAVLKESLTDLKDPKGDIGKSFEADYILNYLKGLDYFGYKARGEFKPRTGSKYKYDIDLVLEDVEQKLFFFIQVKYWFSNLPIYLDEQIKFFNDKNKVQHAVAHQIAALKDNMDERSIRDKLIACGLGGARKSNSYFILLHNIPFLNFYEFSGVIFYEWNVLRNILQNGRVFVQKYERGVEKAAGHIYATDKVPLHKPYELMNSDFGREDIYGNSISVKWDLHKNSWDSFSLNGVKFMVRAF